MILAVLMSSSSTRARVGDVFEKAIWFTEQVVREMGWIMGHTMLCIVYGILAVIAVIILSALETNETSAATSPGTITIKQTISIDLGS